MAFPKLVRNPRTPVRVIITGAEPNEFGEKPVWLDANFRCNYQDSAGVKYSPEKQTPHVTGIIYIDGDILPDAAIINSGHVVIFDERREIIKGTKARNLDGTVNYTRLDVM